MASATYVEGIDLSTIEFNLHSEQMGIHPDLSVLDDPNNPFVNDPIFRDKDDDPGFKWRVLVYANDFGFDYPNAHVLAFYCWATALAEEPTGEQQYYTATRLSEIYKNELVPEKKLDKVKQMAIGGFQSVLDNFPDDVTYDESGTTATRLVDWAYDQIVLLGGKPDGWIKIETDDGDSAVVPIGEN